ncbi:DUF4239 domain-containing protein [Actinomadura sp. DC4]|uniref:bestrophin-like domain n=1 Tax=Actinomadura sp. DC4 TaxID=3055069 RepID=UPI0025B10E71|nr:DUF4239 domain-containing protein [Actinomadura sp. DC4]MDN3360020.1 DUF4239 domain-containing protein [Actinomadura sp. DC4]
MLVCILAVVTAVGVVIVAALLFRKSGRGTDDGDPGGATAGHAGSMLSALFLLVFAIAIVVPWTTADSARENAYSESRVLVEAYWAASALPAPEGREVQADLRGYTDLLVGNEWRLMKKGHLSAEGDTRLNALRSKVLGLPAVTDDQKDDRTAVLEQIQALSAARGQREMDAGSNSPVGLLYMTIFAGIIVMIFPFLAGARPRVMTLVPLCVMAAMLGAGIYLAFNIAHTYTGALRVRTDAYVAAQHQFQQIPESR